MRKPFRAQFEPTLRARNTPARPFHEIALDIKGPLLTTDDNNRYILVVVCLLTRFVVAIPLPDTKGTTIARALVDHVFCVHGCAYRMQVDGASYFNGPPMKALAELFGIRHVTVLPYQPTSNGNAEAMVKRISNMLQRHGNAMRAWDRYLQLVVHGLNATPIAALGATPFFALFGRDPVGIAELEWPELQRLDVDGDEFVKSLASNIRTIWSDLKEASDKFKTNAVTKANEKRHSSDKPLKPGDYVFVEYGDDEHSKRLGKAGLPRRRRFQVLEYWPERGYVKIDTDGLRLKDKVSLSRITRAPRAYTVADVSEPIRIKAHALSDSMLPPGWRALKRHGATRDYLVYEGPGGTGVAKSAAEAWEQFNGDPVFMPQPKLTKTPQPNVQGAASVPLLPAPGSLKAKVPQRVANSTAPSPELPTKLTPKTAITSAPTEPSMLTPDQAAEVMAALARQYAARIEQPKVLHGWTLSYKPRAVQTSQHGDWTAISPAGVAFRSKVRLQKYLKLDAATSPPTPKVSPSPQVGQTIEVHWPGDNAWFPGRIAQRRHSTADHDALLHYVVYDDGQQMWHNLAVEQWRLTEQTSAPAAAHATIGAILQNRKYGETARCMRAHYKNCREGYHQAMLTVQWIWSEDGCPSTL